MTFTYGPKTITVQAVNKQEQDSECQSIFISRHQLSKMQESDQLFSIHLMNTDIAEQKQNPEAKKII